jgi:hypothetical protein
MRASQAPFFDLSESMNFARAAALAAGAGAIGEGAGAGSSWVKGGQRARVGELWADLRRVVRER